MSRDEIASLLSRLREDAFTKQAETLGSHQLEAHWSLAYACGQPPTPWELYRSPRLFGMPLTGFFHEHSNEIQEALQPKATWELLRDHAVPKLELDRSMSEQESKSWGYPNKVLFIDPRMQEWTTVDIPSVRWFDSRELLRESLSESKGDLQAKTRKNLARYERAAASDPSPARLEALKSYRQFIRNELPRRLSQFDEEKEKTRRWLAKLDQTPDFNKHLFTLLRGAENDVRAAHGIASVGEAWVSETELLYRVRKLLPDVEVVAHGRPKWLGRQHLDIWIPSMAVALEYHGVQHFREVEFFGGKEGLQRTNRLRKKSDAYATRDGKESPSRLRGLFLAWTRVSTNRSCVARRREPFFRSLLKSETSARGDCARVTASG
ncbi:MAG: hypothetical protein ACP5NP_08045 [Acetobacteraceae bacterium]